jgi:hypothetical protein
MPQKDTLYGDLFVVGNFEANLIKKTGGTSSQFLKADGSIDSTAYLTTTPTLDQVTTAGNTTTNAISVGGLTVATNLIYTDLVNNRVGIGTTSPLSKLHVETVTSETEIFRAINPGAGGSVNRGAGIIVTMLNTQVTGGKTRLRQYDTAGYATRNFIEFVSGTGGFTGEGSTTISGWYEVGLVTNNALRLWVASTGNVSIGSSTDAGYKLDVNGAIGARQGLTIFSENYLRQEGITAKFSSQLGIFQFDRWQSGPVTAMMVNGWGGYTFMNTALNVGTNSPTITSMLSVYGSMTASSALARGVYFNNTLVAAANNDVLVGLDINPTFTNGAFTGVQNTGLRVFGSTSGNAPTLEVRQTSNSAPTWLSVRNTSSLGSAGAISADLGISGGAGQFFTGTVQGDVVFKAYSQANTSRFFIGATSANTANLVLFTTGNVAINTTTDAGYKLYVNGNIGLSGNLVPTSGTSTVGTFANRFTDFWGSGLIVGTTFYGDNYQTASGTMFFKDGGGVERMRMTSVGNFLIGTTTDPGYKLTVNGDINTSGVFRVGGVAGWTGTITIMSNPPGQQNVHVTGGIITGFD